MRFLVAMDWRWISGEMALFARTYQRYIFSKVIAFFSHNKSASVSIIFLASCYVDLSVLCRQISTDREEKDWIGDDEAGTRVPRCPLFMHLVLYVSFQRMKDESMPFNQRINSAC
jgi:hypothetical protein